MSSRVPVSRARVVLLAERASAMRAQPTTAEALLWEHLRGGRLGRGFRRQLVLGRFIADLACPAARLVVEVDGGYHAQPASQRADARKERELIRLGWRVLRISNAEVLTDLEAVLGRIRVAIA